MKKVFFLFLVVVHTAISAQTDFYQKLSHAGAELANDRVNYDPSYFSMAYPNGDVPKGKGVCTDVIIRAYRKMGIDLQQKVHEDMVRNFDRYPNIWGLTGPDTNIDHRRVPNLMVFFERFGETLAVTEKAEDYRPGAIVCWSLGGGTTHIGLVTSLNNRQGNRKLIIHNIGNGQVLEDSLFDHKIIGHYRYNGK